MLKFQTSTLSNSLKDIKIEIAPGGCCCCCCTCCCCCCSVTNIISGNNNTFNIINSSK